MGATLELEKSILKGKTGGMRKSSKEHFHDKTKLFLKQSTKKDSLGDYSNPANMAAKVNRAAMVRTSSANLNDNKQNEEQLNRRKTILSFPLTRAMYGIVL